MTTLRQQIENLITYARGEANVARSWRRHQNIEHYRELHNKFHSPEENDFDDCETCDELDLQFENNVAIARMNCHNAMNDVRQLRRQIQRAQCESDRKSSYTVHTRVHVHLRDDGESFVMSINHPGVGEHNIAVIVHSDGVEYHDLATASLSDTTSDAISNGRELTATQRAELNGIFKQ